MSAFKEIKSKPELTIILAAVDDYLTVFEAIRSIELQSVAEKLELLIVIESLTSFSAPDDFQTRHPMARVLQAGRPLMLNEARAIGFELASADYGFILEDHCLPKQDCMEQIIHRIHQNKWSVIGPSIEHGNTHSIPGRATNLLTYGEWMGHSRAEERNFVSGYSSAWRCSSLRKLGNHLEKELAIPSRLQQRLKQSGEQIYFAAEATMLHWEASYWRPIIWILFSQGKGMGYIRRGNSSLGSKIIGSLLAPLIAASRTVRGLRAWWRTGAGSMQVALAIPVLALIWTAGELVGYWSSRGQEALRGVSNVERKRQPYIDAIREPIRCPIS